MDIILCCPIKGKNVSFFVLFCFESRFVCLICQAYLQQAQRFLSDGAPLEALGIQSHFSDFDAPDPTLMKVGFYSA